MRYINVHVDNRVFNMWAYVAKGMPTDIIMGRDVMGGNVMIS